MTEHTVVSSRGQMVIPVAFRRRLGIKRGTEVAITEKDGALVVEPVLNLIRSLRGSLKGTGASRYLLAERRRDRSMR